MIALLADENFPGPLVRAIRQRRRDLDLVRVQDVGLGGADDPRLLEWAAANWRVVLSHDTRTLVGFAYDRVARGLPMAGVLTLIKPFDPRQIVDDVLYIADCGLHEDFVDQVRFLPL